MQISRKRGKTLLGKKKTPVKNASSLTKIRIKYSTKKLTRKNAFIIRKLRLKTSKTLRNIA
jgi:hypothetical protein